MTVHMALPVTLPPQLFDSVKSTGLEPPIAMPEMVRVSAPVFVIVNVWLAVVRLGEFPCERRLPRQYRASLR